MAQDSGLILLIEDEPQMRRFLRITLQSHGYRLVEAAAGAGGTHGGGYPQSGHSAARPGTTGP